MVLITLFHTHLFYFKCPSNYYLCILNTYLVSNDVKHELCALHRGISGTVYIDEKARNDRWNLFMVRRSEKKQETIITV